MHIETQPATPISPAEAIAMARDRYGLSATATALPGEFDANFLLTADDERRFVFKVMHPSRDRAFVEMQCEALRTLEARAPQLLLQRVVPAIDGSVIGEIHDTSGERRLVWLLTYVAGRPMAEVRPHGPELLASIGALTGTLDAALLDFEHPATERSFKWDLARARWASEYLSHIQDPSRRALIERCLARYESEVVPALASLRRSVIHNDANDYNLIASGTRAESPLVTSLIDFGDMVKTVTVAEVAIAAAYAVLGQSDPLAAASAVVRGYDGALRLTEQELALVFPLIQTRLMVSVVNSAYRQTIVPNDPYVTISERSAWATLERLEAIAPKLAEYTFRAACGHEPAPQTTAITVWLRQQSATAANVLDVDLSTAPLTVFDLSVGSRFLGADPEALQVDRLSRAIDVALEESHAAVGVGRYDEVRPIYGAAQFATGENPLGERRTVHLGLDLFAPAGSAVYAPLAGTIEVLAHNTAPQDYGPLIILRHLTGDGVPFFSLYGHLSAESLAGRRVGDSVAQGERIASLGKASENGGWPPHLHLQFIVDLLEMDRDFPGVAPASQRRLWTSLSPDPNLLLGIPADRFPAPAPTLETTLASRQAHLGGNLSLSYREPLKIVRGWRQYLYDSDGRAYLDVFNNVPLVGHSHPRVVRAAREQLALLNTNTRYLHDGLTNYVERLTALMPAPLLVAYLVNSGSEANELALRLARTATGRHGVIVLEHAYHGNTSTLIDISPYKFNQTGGTGRKPWVHVAPLPDDYRGPFRRSDPEAGKHYAAAVAEILDRENDVAAFIAETHPSVGGQLVLPPDYLREVYAHVRAKGAICIADEVQVGLGRLGTHFWGFETQGVVPDIVVLGKPIGNGFPLAAVVTTPAIAAAFANGMEFFSTFGGNPVACAAGLAVLDVLEEEALQANALTVGNHLIVSLRDLMSRFSLIGDVRGSGFFLGVELVRDRETLEPATEETAYVVNRLRQRGILAGSDGPYDNVLKLRPPLIFSKADADLFVATLASVLEESALT